MSNALVQDELKARARYLAKTQGANIDAAMDTTSVKENVRGRRWLQSNVYVHVPSAGGIHIFYWSNHLTVYQEDKDGRVIEFWPSGVDVVLAWFRNLMILDDLASIQ